MAETLQLRRGTTSDHASFTGAVGEVTVDTTLKTLRVHDNSTVGGTVLAKANDLYYPDLLDTKWSDHLLDNPSWVLSDGEWKSKTLYPKIYEHIENDVVSNLYAWVRASDSTIYYTTSETPATFDHLYTETGTQKPLINVDSYDDVNNKITIIDTFYNVWSATRDSSLDTKSVVGNPETETIAGTTITYYQAEDGHKIVLPNQLTNADTIYADTGVAWYYILDTENERFKLPRGKHNKYAVALPVAISGNNDSAFQSLLVKRTSDNQTHPIWFQSPYGVYATNNVEADGATYTSGGYNYTFNSLYTDLTQDTDQYKYLYFYIGEFSNVGDRDLNNLLSIIYPVGSLYMGTQTTCPMALVMSNSTWELVSAGKALWTGDGTNANTTIEAGLPNITGQLTVYSARGSGSNPSGSMYIVSSEKTNGCTLASDPVDRIGIDASRSNAIYGKSNTVQPPAYVVNVWRRTA